MHASTANPFTADTQFLINLHESVHDYLDMLGNIDLYALGVAVHGCMHM